MLAFQVSAVSSRSSLGVCVLSFCYIIALYRLYKEDREVTIQSGLERWGIEMDRICEMAQFE